MELPLRACPAYWRNMFGCTYDDTFKYQEGKLITFTKVLHCCDNMEGKLQEVKRGRRKERGEMNPLRGKGLCKTKREKCPMALNI